MRTRTAARLQQPVLGLRARVTGAEKLDAHRPCIYVANHQSVLDVPILAQAFEPGAVVIAKKELRGIPLFGWLYAVTGNILIDRADNRGAVGRLLPFKKGAFHMAVATGAPLVPVVVSPLKPRLDIPARRLAPSDVEIRVLDPIPTAGLSEADVPALLHEARRRMAAALSEMGVERGLLPTPREETEAPAARG